MNENTPLPVTYPRRRVFTGVLESHVHARENEHGDQLQEYLTEILHCPILDKALTNLGLWPASCLR